MHILLYISNYFIPFLILSIIICGLTAKIDVYETFITGAKNGCRTVIRLVPTLIGLMTATGILRASGFLDVISSFIGKFTNLIGFPGELVPLSIVKMFSSSAASGLLVDLYKTYGTDSRIGLIASLSMSCTETIFYTMSVYFMTAMNPPYPVIRFPELFCNLCRTRRQRPARRLLFLIFMIHNSQHRSINNTSIQNHCLHIPFVLKLC